MQSLATNIKTMNTNEGFLRPERPELVASPTTEDSVGAYSSASEARLHSGKYNCLHT